MLRPRARLCDTLALALSHSHSGRFPRKKQLRKIIKRNGLFVTNLQASIRSEVRTTTTRHATAFLFTARNQLPTHRQFSLLTPSKPALTTLSPFFRIVVPTIREGKFFLARFLERFSRPSPCNASGYRAVLRPFWAVRDERLLVLPRAIAAGHRTAFSRHRLRNLLPISCVLGSCLGLALLALVSSRLERLMLRSSGQGGKKNDNVAPTLKGVPCPPLRHSPYVPRKKNTYKKTEGEAVFQKITSSCWRVTFGFSPDFF